MNKLTFASVTSTRNMIGPLALMGLAIVLSACDGGASRPTSPSPISPAPTAATPTATVTYTLSGAVSEILASGRASIQGARVTETSSGRAGVTDTNGLYRITGLSAMSHSLSVTKEGYVTENQTVTMSGDTQLDIRLDRMASYILSGVVFEITTAGQVPIEGVEVYCDSCGSPTGHTSVHTDADGIYSLAWALNGVHPLLVRKAGYEIYDPTGKLRDAYGRISATVHGDTRFDIQLARR
jgi:hypothetical protein